MYISVYIHNNIYPWNLVILTPPLPGQAPSPDRHVRVFFYKTGQVSSFTFLIVLIIIVSVKSVCLVTWWRALPRKFARFSLSLSVIEKKRRSVLKDLTRMYINLPKNPRLRGLSHHQSSPVVELSCSYSHARWSYRRRFRSLLGCPLSVKRYYFPGFVEPLLCFDRSPVHQQTHPRLAVAAGWTDPIPTLQRRQQPAPTPPGPGRATSKTT